MKKFDDLKTKLPSPEAYYLERLKKLNIRGNQVIALCPFHEDSHPSLSINLDRGMFNCFSCGAKGGGIIDFEMKFCGISFREALNSLANGVFRNGSSIK